MCVSVSELVIKMHPGCTQGQKTTQEEAEASVRQHEGQRERETGREKDRDGVDCPLHS